MSGGLPPQVFFLLALALVGGLMAFVRGFLAYRRNVPLTSVEACSVAELAVGEVRLTGTIETLRSTLVSPLQSKPAVWYRASIMDDGPDGTAVLREERAVAFSVRDETGAVQVVPREANWVVPAAYSASTGRDAAEPAGLERRHDAAASIPAAATPAAASASAADSVAADSAAAGSVTVDSAAETTSATVATVTIDATSAGPSAKPASLPSKLRDVFGGKREYQEARLEPGQTVTVVGYAMPVSELPSADPDAPDAPYAAMPAEGETDQLVISAEPGGRLVVYAGDLSQRRGRHDQNFLLGLGGAITASVAAYALVVLVNGSM